MSTTIDSLQIQIQSSSTSAATGIKDLASALAELKKSGALTTVTKNLKGLADALNAFTPVASNASKINSIATSLEKLKSVGSITALTKGVKELPTAFKGLSAIGDVGGIANKLQGLSTALAPLSNIKTSGFNSAISSLSKISDVTKALDDNTISEFTSKVKKLSDALGPLSQKLTSVKSGLNGFTKAADQSGKEVNELGLNVGALNFDALTNNIQTVINALNQFAMAMKEAIAQAIEWDGISSRFGRGFGAQSQEMYDWVVRLNEELGINIQLFMQHSSIFANMLTGFGVANQDASKMALGYMELTYDIWAGYNDIYKTFEEAAEAVRSAIAGEVEPVRRAGFTIVEATLQMTAANYGITKSVETMTEAEKSYLRYLTLIDQAYAQNLVGTYAKELQTAEGMMRTAKQQLKSLTQAFGSLFLPILVKVMPYVQAFITLLTELVHIVAGLFGIEIQKVDWSGYNEGASAIGGMEESADGANKALGNATKAAKELKNATLGIDELNVISPNTGTSGSGAGGTGVDEAFAGLDVNSLWDESIFKGINNQVDEIVKKMREWLGITDDVDTWAELMETRLGTILKTLGGIAIAVTTIKTITGITKVVKAVSGVIAALKGSKIIAGLTKLFKNMKAGGSLAKVGTALGNIAKVAGPIVGIIGGVVLAIDGLIGSLKEGITWGDALKTTLGGAFTGAGIGFLAGGPIGAAIGALVGIVSTAVVNIGIYLAQNWDDVKEWVKNIPKEILKLSKKLDYLPDRIKEWFDNLGDKIDKWFDDLWQPIKDYDWKNLGKEVGKKLGNLVKEVGVSIEKFFQEDLPYFFTVWIPLAWKSIKEFFTKLPGQLKEIWSSVKQGFVDIGGRIVDGIVEGWQTIKKAVGDFIKGLIDGFKEGLGINSPSTVARDEIGKNILLGIIEALKPDGLINAMKTMWNNVKTWWDKQKGNLSTYTPSIGDIKAKLSTAWNTAKSWWDKTKGVLSTYTPSIGDIKSKLSSAWSAAKTWWDKNKGSFSAYTPNIGSIKDKLVSAWNTAKNWWNSNVKLSIPTLNFKVTYTTKGLNTVQKAIVKTLGLSGWPKLSFAANGGMFEQGSMIWAGERGAEIVANASGGKTGVMNVQQMYQAVYDATYSAMVATRQSQPQQSGGSYNLYIDGKQVTTTVEKTQKNRGATIFGTEVYGY